MKRYAALLLAVYYAVPQRQRWWVLLAGSLCFYALAGLKNVIYILITAASTYLAARGMQTLSARQKARFKADPPLSKEEKAACKAKKPRHSGGSGGKRPRRPEGGPRQQRPRDGQGNQNGPIFHIPSSS